MLAIMFAAALPAPQLPPPTTSALMDLPITVISGQVGAELMYSEADQPAGPVSAFDDRFSIADIVTLPPGFTINSFSRGTGALFSVLENGDVSPAVPGEGWSFMLFSVSGSGWDPSSPYAAESSLDGDIFSVIDQGSLVFFPDDQIGPVHKVRDGGSIGVSKLSGLDSYISGYAGGEDYTDEADAELGESGVPRFYFTVRTGSQSGYSQIPNLWVGGREEQKRPSSVFVVSYDVATGEWSDNPSVAWYADELDIGEWREITALSVMDPQFQGADQANGIELLYCTDGPTVPEKIMVMGQWIDTTSGPSGPVVRACSPLFDGNGGYFADTKLGINGPQQRIVATCDEDPGDDGGSSWHQSLRWQRTALVTDESSANPELVFSFHQLRMPANSACAYYRATLQGHVGNNDVTAVLSSQWPTNKPIATVTRNNQNGVDKQSRTVLIKLSGALTEQKMRWYVTNSAGYLLGRTCEFSIFTR